MFKKTRKTAKRRIRNARTTLGQVRHSIGRRYRYESVIEKIPGWHLISEEPVVIIAQPRTRYRSFDESAGRIQPVADDAYVQQLFNVLEYTSLRKAQFCLFPEYAWPLAHVERLFEWLFEHREEQRAYIIPFEHISALQYKQLLTLTLKKNNWIDRKRMESEIAEVEDFAESREDVINGTFTILQSPGRLITIPQRKLRPAALEETRNHDWKMVGGRGVKIVEVNARASLGNDSPPPFRFASLVCFDLITRDDEHGDRPRDALTAGDLNMLFVPECNPQPLHDLYLKSEIAMFQSPRWSQRPPTMIFANAAAGSALDLPPTMKVAFGFSRVIGKTGDINSAGGCLDFKAFVTCESPTALTDIVDRGVIVPDKTIHTIIVRPEQSIVTIHLPNIFTGPTGDASVRRSGTEVDVVRPVGREIESWLRVRDFAGQTDTSPDIDLPSHFKDLQLTGVADYEVALADAMHTHTAPLRVAGSPGVGKSALVASALQHHRGPHDRIVWINLEEVDQREEPLIEAMLTKLGMRAALGLGADRKLDALRRELRRVPTAVVLDNREAWEDTELPARVLGLHGWKTVIIIISKRLREPDHRLPPNELTVQPLRESEFEEVVAFHALPNTAGKQFISLLMRASKRAALGAVWGGRLYRVTPKESQRLADKLALEPNPTLETIFRWFFNELDEDERSILGILCEVAAPIPPSDLAAVLKKEAPSEVRAAVQKLSTLQLIESPAKHGDERLLIAHPFVRQLWRHATENDRALSWSQTLDWALFAADQYGQDRNFAEIPEMRLRWPAIAAVLRRLARDSGDRLWKRCYLRIWRRCDAFLWTYGLWRERIELSRVAVDFARDRDPDEDQRVLEELKQFEVHALYDSIAKTQWHIDGRRFPADDSIQEALTIANELGDNALLARIYWYRSRLLRHCRIFSEAAEYGKKAITLAKNAKKPYTIALALNALGNVFADVGDRRNAGKHYNRALNKIGTLDDPWAEELRAIINRNLGRLDLLKGEPERALPRLERAIEAFGRLHSVIQQAECAVYHAEALIDAGDLDDATRELAWAKSVVAHLGSTVFERIVEAAEARLAMSLTPPS